jgi:minor extracellular serine protease Vpr
MKYIWFFLLGLPLFAADAGSHRYMVELSSPSVAEHVVSQSKLTGKHISMDSGVAQARRREIHGEQKQLQTTLEGMGVTVLERTDTVSNTLIVTMPDALASRVAALPGVKQVQKTRPIKLSLDHALPIHKVPQAWAAVGGMAKAGAGIKIAMIDSGIDVTQPGLQDSTLQMPPGFPKTNADSDVAYTNTKVIVARSYAALFDTPEEDLSSQDDDGHGTGTAMTAAGVQNTGPFGTISGVAPKAWLGAYKVIGAQGSGSDDVIVKAIDDAVADGMDIISMSINGSSQRLSDDILGEELQRVTTLGIVAVNSAGNDSGWVNGNDLNTIREPATAPSVISVGAANSDRSFYPASVALPSGSLIGALTGDGSLPTSPVTAQLFDVATLDQAGDACLPYPTGSMKGMIALIIRTPNGCTFETKLDDVQSAGAVGAVIYDPPDHTLADFFPAFAFGQGAATLAGVLVENTDGVTLKQQLANNLALNVTLNFAITSIPEPQQANQVAFFSGRGPNVDGSIKPDLVAVGTDFYTATETTNQNAELYDPSGYIVGVSGTSYSAPLVAGAVAVLKAYRPGLTVDQYRSLVINTAGAISGTVMETGAGVLNVQNAVAATFAAAPTALSFNVGNGSPNISQTLTISNVGSAAESYSLAVAPRNVGAAAPSLGSSTVTVQPGQSGTVPITFTASNLPAGAYEGFVTIRGSQSGIQERVPYWYGVPSGVPATITPLFVIETDDNETPNAGSRQTDAIEFIVTDASGILLPNVQPTVTALQTAPPGFTGPFVSGGSVINVVSIDNEVPGAFSVTVRLGPKIGANLFEVTVGAVQPFDIEIDGN